MKFTFIFDADAYNQLGYAVSVFADDVFNATEEIINQMNVINKAKNATIIDIDVSDYNTIGSLIIALNSAWSGSNIIRIYSEQIVYPVTEPVLNLLEV